jgi:hydrogenase-4 component B
MIIAAYLAAILIVLFSGLPALLVGQRSDWGVRLSAAVMAVGSLLGFLAACGALAVDLIPEMGFPWALPGAHLLFRLDGLTVVFLLPAFLITGLGALYGLGYFPHHRHPAAAGRVQFLYGVLAASITTILASRNAIPFLVALELMAIAGFLLILTEQEKEEEVRRAAFVYLTSAHVAILTLYALFILLAHRTGSFDFPGVGALSGATPLATALFLLALFGFGLKAGIMPLHIWLPEAHAAAPSHVSAIMSGVVIKIGIYGLVRITSFFIHIPPWWGWTVLILGVVSGVMGVAFALAQHDIKRLLAYHSVENIGIILIGLGVALLGRSFDQPALVVLGLTGALLHVINHGLFKSLLFLSAGAVINATGTRKIDSYGGLLRRMPITALCFLGGAVAICGLPPLNGFVSEWLIYLGLLHSQAGDAPQALTLAVIAAPGLAMIGALAVACFVKVFGVTFLGVARKEWLEPVGEASFSMIGPMAVLLGCCALIGILPMVVVPVLGQALSAWGAVPAAADFPGALAPVFWVSLSALLFLALVGGVVWWQRQRGMIADGPRPATWGCGYLFPSVRMQYTASSFAEMLTGLFNWGVWTEIKGEPPFGFFPGLARFADHTPDVVLDRLLYPAFRGISALAFKVRAFLQYGILGVYLLYVVLTLLLLLTLTLRG